MTHLWLITVMLTAADAGTAADPLSEVLALAAESERKKTSVTCTFIEENVLEQLDSDGNCKGKITRRYETTITNAKVTEHKLISRSVEGSPSSLMEREQERGNETHYSAFHPSQQGNFVFTVEGAPDANPLKVRFVPKDPDEKRLNGTAFIDRRTGLVEKIEGTPSKLPTIVDELSMSLGQSQTACGAQVTSMNLKGKAGLLFLKTRFRSKTTMSEHKLQ